MAYLLGVDAGNTKTVAVVATPQGDIVGCGRSDCGDIYGAGSPDQALAAVDSAVVEALRSAGALSGEVRAGVFSMCGADWPEDFRLLEESFGQRNYARQVTVLNDAIGGLRAGIPEGTGVSVILGTALAVGARGIGGRIWHGSFWIGSLHSYRLVSDIHDAVAASGLGLAPPTALTDPVLRIYQAETVEQFLHAVTRREDPQVAGKGRLVAALLDAAAAGDEAAARIVEWYADGCAKHAIYAAGKVGYQSADRFKIMFSGGQLRHPTTHLPDLVRSRFVARYPHAEPVRSRLEPVSGALLWAFDHAGIPITQEVINRIAVTTPPASFFEST